MDAIVLKTTNYEDDGKILKLFTRESGILSVIVKKITKKETFWQTLTSPLARGEFHLTRRQSDLYTIKDASLTDAYLELRNNLDRLNAACSILRAITTSQYPEKAASPLFHLTIVYLKKLKTFPQPNLLSLSFQMKLLNYEGLFPETKEELSTPLTKDEWLLLECLCHTKNFDLLESVPSTPSLQEKGSLLFQERMQDFN